MRASRCDYELVFRRFLRLKAAGAQLLDTPNRSAEFAARRALEVRLVDDAADRRLSERDADEDCDVFEKAVNVFGRSVERVDPHDEIVLGDVLQRLGAFVLRQKALVETADDELRLDIRHVHRALLADDFQIGILLGQRRDYALLARSVGFGLRVEQFIFNALQSVQEFL